MSNFVLDLSSHFNEQARMEDKAPSKVLLKPVEGAEHDYMLMVDNSALEHFTVCARNAEYYMVRNRERNTPATALHFGGAIHKGLEPRFAYGDPTEVVEQKMLENFVNAYRTVAVGLDDHRTMDRGIDVLRRYNKHYPKELFHTVRDDMDNPYVEIAFAEPLGKIAMECEVKVWTGKEPNMVWVNNIFVIWTGKIDAIVKDTKNWVIDHKTSSVLGDSYFKEFEMSQPAVGYTWAAQRVLLEPVEGLIANVLGIRPITRTGVHTEFHRRRYIYPQWQLDEWVDNTMTLVGDFLSHYKRGYFPMETKWCVNKYGVCPYHSVCSMPPGDRDKILYSNEFKNVTWDPLKD